MVKNKLRLVGKIVLLSLEILGDSIKVVSADNYGAEKWYAFCVDLLKQRRRECFEELFGGNNGN